MKIFILVAIIFFSWRVFSEEGYYYEGRYYKVDEYIRFQDDPNYQAFLNEKRAEASYQRNGVDEYFVQKEKDDAKQERERREHLENLPPQEVIDARLEAAYEKEKLNEQKEQLRLQAEYSFQKDLELEKMTPKRMVASVFETSEDKPLKRVPRESRKYKPKPKSPIEAARRK